VTVQASPLLTIRDVAERLNCSDKQVRRLVSRGELPALKLGAAVRIDEHELAAWLYRDSAA
jgi:excisionase family DNA binding protein